MAYIEMKHSYKRYKTGDVEIIANNDITFEIEKGELVIILGTSGAGKSTVLNILGGMDTNDEGKVIIDGKDISNYNAKQLTVNFVFLISKEILYGHKKKLMFYLMIFVKILVNMELILKYRKKIYRDTY